MSQGNLTLCLFINYAKIYTWIRNSLYIEKKNSSLEYHHMTCNGKKQNIQAKKVYSLFRARIRGDLHLLQRLFVIGLRNNRDCDKQCPYPGKQWKCRLYGTHEIRGLVRWRSTAVYMELGFPQWVRYPT